MLCLALSFVGEKPMNSAATAVFWQQLLFTRMPLLGVSLLGFRWLSQQLDWFACASAEESWAWQQHFPPEEDEQHEPPQQQPVRGEETPRQNGLWVPFGQTQSKCGRPATSVVTAANQTNPAWTTLTTNFIQPFFPARSVPSSSFAGSNRTRATRPAPNAENLSFPLFCTYDSRCRTGKA